MEPLDLLDLLMGRESFLFLTGENDGATVDRASRLHQTSRSPDIREINLPSKHTSSKYT